MGDTRHGLYAVEFDDSLLPGITKCRIETGTDVQGESTSGEVYNRWLSIFAQKPKADFETVAIASALDLCGLSGLDVSGLATGLKIYAQKHERASTRAGATSHRKHTFLDGLVVPRTLTVPHRGDAKLTYDVLVLYDGANDPIIITDAVTLPAGVTDNERFTLGPVTIESITLTTIQNMQIDFGITGDPGGGDSSIWDTYTSIRGIRPKLSLSGFDIEWMKAANIPLLGKSVSHANTAIFLRKRSQDLLTFVADDTAEHIKLTAAGLAHIEVPLDASDDGYSTTSLQMPLKYDGVNAPLVINTASAIT